MRIVPIVKLIYPLCWLSYTCDRHVRYARRVCNIGHERKLDIVDVVWTRVLFMWLFYVLYMFKCDNRSDLQSVLARKPPS